MKIAVPAEDGSLDAEISMVFGRAKYFILVDSETEEFQVVDNKQNVLSPMGAGIQAAQTVANNDAQGVIAVNCGPKAFKTLKAAGIGVFLTTGGKIRETLESYKSGKLKPAKDANVEAHSGI
jgi:predicted Fe-Mo cluster-binding NifX family protein